MLKNLFSLPLLGAPFQVKPYLRRFELLDQVVMLILDHIILHFLSLPYLGLKVGVIGQPLIESRAADPHDLATPANAD